MEGPAVFQERPQVQHPQGRRGQRHRPQVEEDLRIQEGEGDARG